MTISWIGIMTDLNIIVSTVKRPKDSPYLDRLIKSIRQDYDGIIYLIIGGKNTAYTDKYTDGFNKIFIRNDEERLSTPFKKASYGYYRALTIDRTKPCIIFEDDAVLVKDWYKKFKHLLTFVNEDKYIISLLSPSKWSVPMPDIDIPSLQPFVYQTHLEYKNPGQPTTTVVTYSNTTGIYYPASLLQTRLAEFIYEFSVRQGAMYDISLGQFLFRCNILIHIAVPNLLKFDVDSTDSSLGSEKKIVNVNYTDWNYTKQ